jgi:hypothetical protein
MRALLQPTRTDCIDDVPVQAPRIQSGVDFPCERNGGIDTIPKAGNAMCCRVNIDVERGMKGPKFRESRHQALRCEQGHDTQSQPHDRAGAGQRLDGVGKRIENRSNKLQEFLTILIWYDLLMPPFEQGAIEKPLKGLNPPAERWRGKRQLLGRRFDRPEAGNLHKGFNTGKGWQTSH